jgi:restriction system protein
VGVPGFQTIMLPLLRLVGDGEHTLSVATSALSDEVALTAAERAQMLPSGRQTTFANRAAWASSYLTNAGLLERTGRGRYQITARGRSVLDENPTRIDIKYLMRFPEFRAFRGGGRSGPGAGSASRGRRSPPRSPAG